MLDEIAAVLRSVVLIAFGGAVGFILSEVKHRGEMAQIQAEHAEREAHALATGERIVEVEVPVEHHEKPARRRPALSQLPVVIALALVLFGLFQQQQQGTEMQDLAESNKEQGVCVQDLFVEYVVGADEVRIANSRYQAADGDADIAFAELIGIALNPDTGEDERRRAALAYQEALDMKIEAKNALDLARQRYPLPTAEDIKRC